MFNITTYIYLLSKTNVPTFLLFMGFLSASTATKFNRIDYKNITIHIYLLIIIYKRFKSVELSLIIILLLWTFSIVNMHSVTKYVFFLPPHVEFV